MLQKFAIEKQCLINFYVIKMILKLLGGMDCITKEAHGVLNCRIKFTKSLIVLPLGTVILKNENNIDRYAKNVIPNRYTRYTVLKIFKDKEKRQVSELQIKCGWGNNDLLKSLSISLYIVFCQMIS